MSVECLQNPFLIKKKKKKPKSDRYFYPYLIMNTSDLLMSITNLILHKAIQKLCNMNTQYHNCSLDQFTIKFWMHTTFPLQVWSYQSFNY